MFKKKKSHEWKCGPPHNKSFKGTQSTASPSESLILALCSILLPYLGSQSPHRPPNWYPDFRFSISSGHSSQPTQPWIRRDTLSLSTATACEIFWPLSRSHVLRKECCIGVTSKKHALALSGHFCPHLGILTDRADQGKTDSCPFERFDPV